MIRHTIALLLLAGVALAQPIRPTLFEIPGHGRLRVVIPLEWTATAKVNAQPSAAIVHVFPLRGAAFDGQMTTVWLDQANRARMTPDTIKANVRKSAETLLKNSQNQSVIMKELRGEDIAGHYYTLGDSNPGQGEFKYITQGTYLAGELLVAFRFQHRAADSSDLAQFLEMLAGSRQVS